MLANIEMIEVLEVLETFDGLCASFGEIELGGTAEVLSYYGVLTDVAKKHWVRHYFEAYYGEEAVEVILYSEALPERIPIIKLNLCGHVAGGRLMTMLEMFKAPQGSFVLHQDNMFKIIPKGFDELYRYLAEDMEFYTELF
jgi:hypothetical protein